MQCMAEKNYFNWQSTAGNFDKKPQAKKKGKISKGNIRKTDSVYLPPCFRVLQKKILQTAFASNVWHNAFYSNIMPSSFPENLDKI